MASSANREGSRGTAPMNEPLLHPRQRHDPPTVHGSVGADNSRTAFLGARTGSRPAFAVIAKGHQDDSRSFWRASWTAACSGLDDSLWAAMPAELPAYPPGLKQKFSGNPVGRAPWEWRTVYKSTLAGEMNNRSIPCSRNCKEQAYWRRRIRRNLYHENSIHTR